MRQRIDHSTYLPRRQACRGRRASRAIGLAVAGLAWQVSIAAGPRAWSQAPPEHAQTPPVAVATSEADPDQQREAMIRWIDEELVEHVLYRPDEIDALRVHVATLAPASLDAFVTQTAPLRELMRRPEWQAANKFFRYYRTLQPVLTSEQWAQLAAGAATLAPYDVVRLMRVLIDQRARLVASHQASQWQNQLLAARRSNIIADQDRMRRYALERASARSNRSYFASHQGPNVRRRTEYSPPPPLITSREVARWAVWRGVFGRRF